MLLVTMKRKNITHIRIHIRTYMTFCMYVCMYAYVCDVVFLSFFIISWCCYCVYWGHSEMMRGGRTVREQQRGDRRSTSSMWLRSSFGYGTSYLVPSSSSSSPSCTSHTSHHPSHDLSTCLSLSLSSGALLLFHVPGVVKENVRPKEMPSNEERKRERETEKRHQRNVV